MKTTPRIKKIKCLQFKPLTDFEKLILRLLEESYKQGVLLEQLLFTLIDSDVDDDQTSQEIIYKFLMENDIKEDNYNKAIKEYYSNHTLSITSSSTIEMILINEGVLHNGTWTHSNYHLIHEKFDMLNNIELSETTFEAFAEQAGKLMQSIEFIKSLPK